MLGSLSRLWSHARALVVLAAVVGVVMAVAAAPASAAAAPLTATPITWDVIGLDSNNTAAGPNQFPVGSRVCNISGGPSGALTATFVWDSVEAAIDLDEPLNTTRALGSLADGACTDVYFLVEVVRNSSSYNTSREYRITVTDGVLSAATPAGRQVYVEKLVSQNRNTTKKISGPGGCNADFTVCDPAQTSVSVGDVVTYKLYAQTSTAYEQIEAYVTFPGAVFDVLESSAEYSNPAGSSSSSLYGDACGWDRVPTSPTYNDCIGPENYVGGKLGGRVIVTYKVRVREPGTGTLNSVVYDFSGSSYHYNADYGSGGLSINVVAGYPLGASVVGGGKVEQTASSSAGTAVIDCGFEDAATLFDCASAYAPATTVTLVATPKTGETFTAWSGDVPVSCTDPFDINYVFGQCIVTMDQARNVVATFSGPVSYPLFATVAGPGSLVTDVGAVCSVSFTTSCNEAYASGTVVTLTASPDPGTTASWGGACAGTVGNTCVVTMSQARNATVAFVAGVPTTYPLTTAVTGKGVVTGSTGQISCSAVETDYCSDTYVSGKLVTLTAAPSFEQRFIGWGGACSGTALTCTVTMSAARSVTAEFGPIQKSLVTTVTSGTGTIDWSVADRSCATECSADFDIHYRITLVAKPAAGQVFDGWGGACSGTATTCTVTLDEDVRLTAAFKAAPAPAAPTPVQEPAPKPAPTRPKVTLTASVEGKGSVRSSVPGISCGADCTEQVPSGQRVTLTATPRPGYRFAGWGGSCSGTATTCIVTMYKVKSVVARFVPDTLPLRGVVTGSGQIASKPAGLQCPDSCTAAPARGALVTLTAVPGPGQKFTGWSGDCAGSELTCTVTMDKAKTVRARFVADAPKVVLSVKADRRSVKAGETIRVTLTAKNVRRLTAEGVVMCAPIPEGFVLVSAPGATIVDGRPCWKVGSLAGGKAAQRQMVLRASRFTSPKGIAFPAELNSANAGSQRATAPAAVVPAAPLAPEPVTG